MEISIYFVCVFTISLIIQLCLHRFKSCSLSAVYLIVKRCFFLSIICLVFTNIYPLVPSIFIAFPWINPYMDVIYNSLMWLMPSAFAMSMLLALQPFIIHLYDITSVIYFMASKPDPIYIDLTQSSPEPDNAPVGGSAPEPENTTGESSSAVEEEETEDAGPSKLDKGKGKAESGESTPYDQFNELIAKRTELRSL